MPPHDRPRRRSHHDVVPRRSRPWLLALLALVLVGAGCGDDDGGDGGDRAAGDDDCQVETILASDRPGADPDDEAAGGEEAPAPTDAEGTATVFAAASLTDVFTEIAEDFEATNPGVTVDLSFGPSSGLATQINEGAPADVLATASTTTMDQVVEAGSVTEEPDVFATNLLELAVPPENPGCVGGLADLADEDLVVGLCAEEVPCGDFARQALEGAGIEASVDTDEPDVRALLTKVEEAQVDVGVVYRTDVIAAGDGVEGIEIPADENVAATYPIAPVADAANPEAATAFVDFVLSDAGQAALAAAGFSPPA